MKKLLPLIASALLLQSCQIVMVPDYKAKPKQEEETVEKKTDVACVQVNTTTGTYTIDASGCVAKAEAGSAYKASLNAALNAPLLAYHAGDTEWQKDHDAWLDADDNQPMPEELNQWDGKAYQDAVGDAINPINIS